MIIQNALRAILDEGTMIVVRVEIRKMVKVAAVNSSEYDTETFELHCIKLQFSFYGVKVTPCSFHFLLHLLEE